MKMGKWEYGGASLEIGIATALPVAMRKAVVMLSKLRTDADCRRQGHASALLAQVAMAADIADKMVMLKVGEGEDGAASKQDLVSFYERNGFLPIQAEPLLMLRTPLGMRLRQARAMQLAS